MKYRDPEFLVTILSGITLMTYQGIPCIGDIAQAIQQKADHDGTPVAVFFEGAPLLALPNGDKRLLVDGYYNFRESKENRSEESSLGFFGSILTTQQYVDKLPYYTGWIRSILLPGETT